EAAREAAPLAHRSLAAQVEHWAALGRAIEGSLTSQQSATLMRSAVQVPSARPYSAAPAADPAQILTAALEQSRGAGPRGRTGRLRAGRVRGFLVRRCR